MKLLKFNFNLLFYKKVFTIKNNVKNDNLIILIYFFKLMRIFYFIINIFKNSFHNIFYINITIFSLNYFI